MTSNKDITFAKRLALVEFYWRCSSSKKFYTYAAALRQNYNASAKEAIKKAVLDCELCKEVVKERKGFMDRRYGLLERCDHVFCLQCIRTFRQLALTKKKEVKSCSDQLPCPVTCPVCGEESSIVASSKTWYGDPDSKTGFIEIFKREMKSMPCPWIRGGLGMCMFPDRCVARE